MKRRIEVTVMVLAALAPGCEGGEATDTVRQESNQPCPDWGCGQNSASVDGELFFHELSTCEEVNSAGVSLVDALKRIGTAMQHVKVEVRGDQLIGRYTLRGVQRTLQGPDLVGTILVLQTPGGNVQVTIERVGSIDYWVSPGAQVPTYLLTWLNAGTTTPLCNNHDLSDEWVTFAGTDATDMIVFAGDRYDGAHKTVHADASSSSVSTCWFNAACAGSAAAKMHLLRHTTAGSDAKHVTTEPQRQAMLKMITDDICGTGESFTVNGEHVYYEDARGWHPIIEAPASIEALWDEHGAMCLDVPRRLGEDPSVADRIQSACAAAGHALPACPFSASNFQSWRELAQTENLGYGLSANPITAAPPTASP